MRLLLWRFQFAPENAFSLTRAWLCSSPFITPGALKSEQNRIAGAKLIEQFSLE
jgi:hypothetical protein